MSIELVAKKSRDSERQIAFIKVDGIEFSVGNVPIELSTDANILTWLNKNENYYKFLILQKQYPNADWQRFKTEKNDNYSALKDWISAGHKNKIQTGLTAARNPKYGYEVIPKQELQYKHPKSVRILALIEASAVAKEIKDLLIEIVK